MTKVISLRKKKTTRNGASRISHQKIAERHELLKGEKYKAILALAAILGILAGSIIYKTLPNTAINAFIEGKLNLLRGGSFTAIIFELIKTDMLFMLATFFLGTSCLGASIAVAPPVIKCILIGYIGSYFYNEYGLKGVLFCLLLIYPYFVITTASLIFASNESIYMSNYIFKLLGNKNTGDDISMRLYFLRYSILIIINLACAVTNSALIMVLAPRISLH